MSNPFSFEYGEEEEEKRPQASVKKHVAKPKKKVEVTKEEKPLPPPEDPSPIAAPEQPSPVIAVVEPTQTTSTVVIQKEIEKQIDSSAISPVVVGTVAVVATATAAIAAGPSALAKLKSLRGKSSGQSKQNSQKQEQQRKQEEKKKEEQTKCDAKSQEVQNIIDETLVAIDDLSVNIESFFEIKGDKELNKVIEGLKEEIKKTKKLIKNLE